MEVHPYERDPESGFDYAVQRYYGSSYGRFTTADLLPGRLQNPQSLNRYSYVTNDPVNFVDPLGLDGYTCNGVQSCSFVVTSWAPSPSDDDGVPGGTVAGVGGGFGGAGNSGTSLVFRGGGGKGGGSGPARDTAPGISEARRRLQNQKCKDLFNKGTDSVNLLDTLSQNGLIQVNNTYPKPGDPQKRESFENGNTGAETTQAAGLYPLPTNPSARASAPVITINQNGFYFSGRMTDLTPVNQLPEFSGLTVTDVQGAVIIHELLHAAGAVAPDGDDPSGRASQQISQDVFDHCFKGAQ